MLVIDDLPAALLTQLESRAADNRRTIAAEVLAILQAELDGKSGASFAAELQRMGREAGVTTEFDNLRDHTPAEYPVFE